MKTKQKESISAHGIPVRFCRSAKCERYRQVTTGELHKVFTIDSEPFLDRCRHNCLFSALDYFRWEERRLKRGRV
jgi:hypothetical protein